MRETAKPQKAHVVFSVALCAWSPNSPDNFGAFTHGTRRFVITQKIFY
jgi:hypothetical protein